MGKTESTGQLDDLEAWPFIRQMTAPDRWKRLDFLSSSGLAFQTTVFGAACFENHGTVSLEIGILVLAQKRPNVLTLLILIYNIIFSVGHFLEYYFRFMFTKLGSDDN